MSWFRILERKDIFLNPSCISEVIFDTEDYSEDLGEGIVYNVTFIMINGNTYYLTFREEERELWLKLKDVYK